MIDPLESRGCGCRGQGASEHLGMGSWALSSLSIYTRYTLKGLLVNAMGRMMSVE